MPFQKLSFPMVMGAILWTATTAQFIYLNSGAFKFIAGVGMPINVEMSGGSLSWFTNVQVFYKLPDNISYFEPLAVAHKRAVRSTFNRANLYEALLGFSERFGFSGDECIHRMICEVAQRRVNRSANGLLGEIVHVLFSPGRDADRGLREHKEAQWHGMYNASGCELRYRNCRLKRNLFTLW